MRNVIEIVIEEGKFQQALLELASCTVQWGAVGNVSEDVIKEWQSQQALQDEHFDRES